MTLSPIYIDDQQQLLHALSRFPKRYLLIGSGAGLQYADPEQAIRDVITYIQADDDRDVLIIFGGDTADQNNPDLGYLVQQLKIKLRGRGRVLSVQSWPEHCSFVDYIYQYPREWSDDRMSRELWGGVIDHSPVAATRYYLSQEMQAALSAVICIGGGQIAQQELSYALKCGLKHHYIRAEARHKRDSSLYGPTDDWYVKHQPISSNER